MKSPDMEIGEHILARLKEGDMDAFKEVFVVFQPKLYYFVLKYLKCKEDTEEIVQEVFVQIWENRSGINTGLSFRSYLFTITKNKIIDYFRKKKLEKLFRNYMEHFIEIMQDSTYRELLFKEYDVLLSEAIDKLPEKRRIIFIMNKRLGMSRNEIARFFDISENTVKNQLQEAMNFLREMVRKEILLWLVLLLSVSLGYPFF